MAAKPAPPSQLDRSNPLVSSLAAAFPFSVPSASSVPCLVDAANDASLVSIGLGDWSVDADEGRILTLDGASDGMLCPTGRVGVTGSLSFLLRFKRISAQAGFRGLMETRNAANTTNNYGLHIKDDGNAEVHYHDAGGTDRALAFSAATFPVGSWRTFIAVLEAGASTTVISCYANGTLVAQSGALSGAPTAHAGEALSIGYYGLVGVGFANIAVSVAYVFDAALDAAAIASLTADPYLLLRTPGGGNGDGRRKRKATRYPIDAPRAEADLRRRRAIAVAAILADLDAGYDL